MVEPCRRWLAVDLRKEAVGGIVYVKVISASKLSPSILRGSPLGRQQAPSVHSNLGEHFDDKNLKTFVEIELEELTRRTNVRQGSDPRWDSTFNMVLHEETGIIRFKLYECTPSNINYDYLASCEIKMKYVADDSTTFWAIGPHSSIIAKRAQFYGNEVEMTVPSEGANSGELTVKLVTKECQFSDGSHGLNNIRVGSQQTLNGSSSFLSGTGRKINVIVVEGKDLIPKDKCRKCDPYVKLQYGKILQRTRTAHSRNPRWYEKFELDEIANGEYLKIKCFNEEIFGDDNIGNAHVNLEGLVEGSVRDIWGPLETVNSGELRLQIEAGSNSDSGNCWIELVIIEAKDLVAADLRGTSDPYVRVQYGNLKKRTKVLYRTLNPQWHQTLEFPDDGSALVLHVKDHNALLPTWNIGDCVVEYQRLPSNQMFDKWIPLQGVTKGEIHIQVTRKIPEIRKKSSLDSESSVTRAHRICSQMKQMMVKLQSYIDEGNLEELSTALSELEALEDTQEEYMVQLETEQILLLNKIKELGQEIFNSSPSISRRSSGTSAMP